ncbi:MAG: haloalkane dehalogenase [Pseudomonadota bacterium]
MDVLRTPDARFSNLADFPFEPVYTEIKTDDGSDLRIHHIDEGPKDGPTILCMHGQPAWSYLYRKMIPILTAAGMRVIAPDLPGFGKSDKPARREDYSYQRQVDWMNAWLTSNNFSGLTFFGQDWGGLIGLRLVAGQPDRFDRVVISNTGLPHVTDIDMPDDMIQMVKEFKANAPTPSLIDMGRAIAKMEGDNRAMQFAYWQKFCWETEDLPVGVLMAVSNSNDSRLSQAVNFGLSKLGMGKLINSPIAKAYSAPFPDASYKMGPRAMPSQVPSLPDDPSQQAQGEAWEVFRSFEKPFLCAFGDSDPVTRGGDQQFIESVPGAKGQPHTHIEGAGHFIQEQAPEALSKTIIDFVRATPAT